ncbi:DUF3262 family protein [Paracidovorax valerianellae]|uniref:Transglycosylase SLT domain-containing protein n=1 Tax=Paracidovorax valerianellae TaxID=187868 RepID=A0A1G7F6M0_9BURK|nr:DUF3262 family protein [Paracidovorax valerianellae]MDA8445624.1 DUF3262 family protein [Paracidovorax valerianellae]SDE71501.1 Protein of unknown function [Paracidovorax valerianellae]
MQRTFFALCSALLLGWLALLATHMPASAQQRLVTNDRVTADQVAQAIANSPNASQWLRANANAVGNLAINVESGGYLSVYNGSCCYGVLQMNNENIRQATDVTPAEFRTWSLQRQVDAWSRVMSQALQATPAQALAALGTFDGRRVDANMILACVQLGIGNCQRMIASGRCSGFADSNGTTICGMADRIAGNAPSPTTPGTTAPSTPISSGGGIAFNNGCIRGSDGQCVPVTEALRIGFEQGSGVSMARMRSIIQMLLVAITLLVVSSAMVGVWQQYARGVIDKATMMEYMQKGCVIVMIVFAVMTIF